ncbi:MAG TPA: ATP-binding protein [Arachidicoccus sp.]|nr:ATP-binding protein [Arachidicoccus sp.]
MTEFDIHDERHSEKLIENIEMLLGETAESLSAYELFLLQMAAFLHDCAMAPSDWEINTMKLTEGSNKFFQNEFSIKHDLKTSLKFPTARKVVIENKAHLYKEFNSDVKNWMFSPRNEDELIVYLSFLLIEYQNYRNGFTDQLKKVKAKSQFDDLNNFIRIDYIRATHHTRIETYIKNLEDLFSNAFDQHSWGKKLASDLALICRSHGENPNFIEQLSTDAQYYGSESANLQMVAMLLRMGDIIHFSYDRAPLDLRSSKLFKSEYSFQQWAIKANGVNYSIKNGKISFRAYCESPETYFKLHQYIDWIEIEIQNFFKYQRQWKVNYIQNLQDRVDRGHILNDESSFLPQRGLSITLNQKKILELLMGVGLYKDKFACLRELYQNSMDAVKCMLSLNASNKISIKGKIIFSIQQEEEDVKYLCCVDNGIGMTKEIIENFLLKIGNSYYKSADFYKQQAKWGGNFTPTSQFGIGILSCFMIGDKIEIATKAMDTDYISCAIERHETFYYKKTSEKDKELIVNSGTIIKIRLNEDTAQQINTEKLNKLGLLMLGMTDQIAKNLSPNYSSVTKNWDKHLFNKVNEIVKIVPESIDVYVVINDGSELKVDSKPILIDFEDKSLGLDNEDLEAIDRLNSYRRFYPIHHKYSDIKNIVETYKITIEYAKTEFRTTLTLPKSEFLYENANFLYSLPKVGTYGVCIDGISIEQENSINPEKYYSHALYRIGIVNFSGDIRPQLSVDRKSIVSYPDECEKIAEELARLLITKILKVTKQHINERKIESRSKAFNLIWEYVFEKIGFADTLFINEFSQTQYGEIIWKGLNDKLQTENTIRDFITLKETTIDNYNFRTSDVLTQKLLLAKFIAADKINVIEKNVIITQKQFFVTNLVRRRWDHSDEVLLVATDDWNVFDQNFDIISTLYPLIPNRLFGLLNQHYTTAKNERIKIVQNYSNGIASFFSQDPILIHEKMGLYLDEKDSYGRIKSRVYNFSQKRTHLWLPELNENKHNSKEVYVLVVYIASKCLTPEQSKELQQYIDKDPSYVKGVNEGWSILVTCMEMENTIIIPGKATRLELVSLLSNTFWEEYKEYTFKFTNGVIMSRNVGRKLEA